MEFYRTTIDRQVVIIDKEEFNNIENLAKANEEKIEELAEKKFLDYIKDNGIEMKFRINDVPKVFNYGIVEEVNYDERGWPESINETVKHIIVDDIKHYVEDHFKYYQDNCRKFVKNEMKLYKIGCDSKVRCWKYIFIITLFLLLGSCFL